MAVHGGDASLLTRQHRIFGPSPWVPLHQASSPAHSSPDRKIRGARNKIPESRKTENSSRSSRPLATVGRTLSSMIRVIFSSLLVCTGHTPTMRSAPVSHIETVGHIFTCYILIAFFCHFICQRRIAIYFVQLNILCYMFTSIVVTTVNHAHLYSNILCKFTDYLSLPPRQYKPISGIIQKYIRYWINYIHQHTHLKCAMLWTVDISCCIQETKQQHNTQCVQNTDTTTAGTTASLFWYISFLLTIIFLISDIW